MLKQPLVEESETYNILIENVPKLQQINRSLRKGKKIVGSINDTKSFRDGLNNDIINGQNIVKLLIPLLYELGDDDNKSNNKMLQQAMNTQNTFNSLKSDIQQLLLQHNNVNIDQIPSPVIQQPQQQQQQQQQHQEQEQIVDITMDVKLKQMENDEERMKNITEEMSELKEAHTTLNELATENGEKIEVIHKNIQRARDDVELGANEIQEAERKKKRRRKRRCWFLIILVFMMAILFGSLAITGSFNNGNHS